MVILPEHKGNIHNSKYEKPLYYYKDVKLEMDGFKFGEITELNVEDPLPETIDRTTKDNKMAVMNDLFFVYVAKGKEIATIILRKNMKFTKNQTDTPGLVFQPTLIREKEFATMDEPEEALNFYKFCKLIENEKIRIRFESDIHKVLLNGDQIIFLLAGKVVIYTLFSSNVIELKANDIAVNRYLYILTDDAIHIYDDKLIKTIPVNKRCRFIIPTPTHIFLIYRSVIYKIVNDVAEVYLDTLSYAQGCVQDDRYMYISTHYSLYKIGLYDQEVTSIQLKIWNAKLFLNDNFIVVFSSSSGMIYIDKNDFSKFVARNLHLELCDITTYGNTMVYLCSDEIIFCEYEYDNNCLKLVDIPNNEDNKIDIDSIDDVKKAISEYKMPHPYTWYGMNAYQRKSKAFSKLINFVNNPEISDIISECANHKYTSNNETKCNEIPNINENNHAISSLLPSPLLSQKIEQNPFESLFLDIFDQNEILIENENPKIEQIIDNEDIKKIKKGIRRVYKRLQKYSYQTDELSSESDVGLFFNDQENEKLATITNPILKLLPETFKSKVKHKKTKKIQMYKAFKRIYSKIGYNHPVTYTEPSNLIDRESMGVIITSKQYSTYSKSVFFVKNHFEYFKKKFKPRDNTVEKPFKGVISSFIDDELKKIVGYKQAPASNKPEQNKMKRGGF